MFLLLCWMGRIWGLLLLLLGDCSGSSSHSLHYFDTGISEPGLELPRFIAVGYVDSQLFLEYDSNTRRKVPRVPWSEKVAEELPHMWKRMTSEAWHWEQNIRKYLERLQDSYNKSSRRRPGRDVHTGFHTLQFMSGCELGQGRPSRSYWQFAYDGKDFISFDKETFTWTVADAKAEVIKKEMELEKKSQDDMAYLEAKCIKDLQMFLQYGKETLLRKVPPKVHVKSKAEDDGLETFVFRFHGFYPKEMDVTWVKDGEVWTQDTFQGRVAPNSDGTYYTWHSITIHPKEKDRYRCHVEHDGLEEPLDLAVEDSAGSGPVGVILGSILGVLAAFNLLIIGIALYKKRQEKAAYNPASRSDQGSDSSTRSAV